MRDRANNLPPCECNCLFCLELASCYALVESVISQCFLRLRSKLRSHLRIGWGITVLIARIHFWLPLGKCTLYGTANRTIGKLTSRGCRDRTADQCPCCRARDIVLHSTKLRHDHCRQAGGSKAAAELSSLQ